MAERNEVIARHPRTTFICPHMGSKADCLDSAADDLDAYPNLMMNLKMVRPGSSLRWQHLGPISNQDDELFEDWAQLFEAMPERFMIGTDARFGEPQYQGKRYHKTIKRLRRALGSLNPSAAELIANGNANRLFFGADLAAR